MAQSPLLPTPITQGRGGEGLRTMLTYEHKKKPIKTIIANCSYYEFTDSNILERDS